MELIVSESPRSGSVPTSIRHFAFPTERSTHEDGLAQAEAALSSFCEQRGREKKGSFDRFQSGLIAQPRLPSAPLLRTSPTSAATSMCVVSAARSHRLHLRAPLDLTHQPPLLRTSGVTRGN